MNSNVNNNSTISPCEVDEKMMLVKFKQFVDEITAQSGRNYKISILEKYKDDEDIKYLLNFIYNPYITTGISTKSYSRFHNNLCIDSYPKNIFNSTREALEYLKVHNTSDDNTRELMFSYYINTHLYEVKILLETGKSVDLHELFYCIITKNIQLGVDVLTINKVIPNLIPTFNVQLANKYFDKPEIVEGKEFALTTKIDGGRIIAIKENGNVSFYTRAGQKYEGLVDLENDLLNLPIDNICFDGEITLLDKGNLTSKDQYKQTMKITRKDGEKHGVKMLVFDVMTSQQFKDQKCESTYHERRSYLNKIFLENKLTYFENLPVLYEGNDTSEITKWLNYNIEHGEEGVMINILNARYEFKRSNNLLKVKKMNDIDLPILDFEEGTNRHTGKLGAIITEYKGCKLKVGSGFSDELRKEIWNNKEDYRGLTMVVQYFEETTNQQGGLSLRFPVFLDFRLDK